MTKKNTKTKKQELYLLFYNGSDTPSTNIYEYMNEGELLYWHSSLEELKDNLLRYIEGNEALVKQYRIFKLGDEIAFKYTKVENIEFGTKY